jgi:hypothetical protein
MPPEVNFTMTELLERAFAEASKLPEAEQDELASILLQELEAERRWDELFARSESAELLSRMADAALAEARAGRARKLDVDEL